jgi:hypothetical protein
MEWWSDNRRRLVNDYSITPELHPTCHQMFTRLSAGRTIAEPSGTLNAF